MLGPRLRSPVAHLSRMTGHLNELEHYRHGMTDRIPVTVLTGYLGAGKTTLVNRILAEGHGRRIAVIVNEIGEIGIDGELIVGSDEELVELSNGVLKPMGLSQVSFTTLMVLRAAGSHAVNPSLLCEATGESRANMTRIADDLAEKGLIQRVPSAADRRRLDLTLTADGQRLIRRLLPRLWQRLTPAFQCFDASEKKLLSTLLKRQLKSITEPA